MIVEDNADVVAYLISCLAGEYAVTAAQNGREGIDHAFEQIPDLIISDVMMPETDGFQLCETLKQDERTCHIPVTLLTAKADMKSRIEGLKHGADAYLIKPFNKEELLICLDRQLGLRRRLRQHYLLNAGSTQAAVTGPPTVPPPVEDPFVKRVREIVEANLSDFGFDVRQLCKAVYYSPSQVNRKLEAVTGLSANQFIRLVRLQKASGLLLMDPPPSVTSIAFDCGFQDPEYFGRVFRRQFGVPPTEWRDKQRKTT